jgi:Tfp pilus assembly protein PilF
MLRVSPTNSVAHFKLANEYRDDAQPELAARHYEEALRIHPTFGPARRELARLRARADATWDAREPLPPSGP